MALEISAKIEKLEKNGPSHVRCYGIPAFHCMSLAVHGGILIILKYSELLVAGRFVKVMGVGTV